jgi:hypothetical protein
MFALNEIFLSTGEVQALQQVAKSYEISCPEVSTAWDGFKNAIKSKIAKSKESASIQELEVMASTATFLVTIDAKINKKQAEIDARRAQLLDTINGHLTEL